MSHLLVRLFQLLCAVAIAGVAAWAKPAPQAEEARRVWVALLGEAERADGSWDGVDLLRHPERRVDRLQVTVRPEAPLRLALEAEIDGARVQLFPAGPAPMLLEPGKTYALPGPRQFFEVSGKATLRLRILPPDGERGPTTEAAFTGDRRSTSYALSDGAPATASEAQLDASGRAPRILELALGR